MLGSTIRFNPKAKSKPSLEGNKVAFSVISLINQIFVTSILTLFIKFYALKKPKLTNIIIIIIETIAPRDVLKVSSPLKVNYTTCPNQSKPLNLFQAFSHLVSFGLMFTNLYKIRKYVKDQIYDRFWRHIILAF